MSVCYTGAVATPRTTRRRVRPQARRPGSTAVAVRSAAERAVDRVLSSEEALALLVRRLEEAGWHVERDVPPAERPSGDPVGLTPPARAR